MSVTVGANVEVPKLRVGNNGWMASQTGVSETLMGIDYDLDLDLDLSRRLVGGGEQVTETPSRRSRKRNLPASNARVASVPDLAGMTAEGDRAIVFEVNSPTAARP